MRGNRHHPHGHGVRIRSIPACAGEPTTGIGRARAPPVYPRVCGGTTHELFEPCAFTGLSPRVRGNRWSSSACRPSRRSIPACAGEPSSTCSIVRMRRVYPRVCGGTWDRPLTQLAESGLSPRVRGNHVGRQPPVRDRRSIPACAGEPAGAAQRLRHSAVYPRVCGGTTVLIAVSAKVKGLSPRVRGNLLDTQGDHVARRSIPACAGEPFPCRRLARVNKVYPRVCGGTSRDRAYLYRLSGLSPRVRGNPAVGVVHFGVSRSIPACAGEPPFRTYRPCSIRVYPRVCGGTMIAAAPASATSGLSPRVRGNPDAASPHNAS